MKKIKIALAFLMVVQSLLAQTDDLHGFAIIKDKDGFTNIREEPNVKSKIVGTIKDDELFYCLWNEGHDDWYEIDFRASSGFIHRSRIQSLADLPHENSSKQIKDTLFLAKERLLVKIVKADFIELEHKIVENRQKGIFLVDGKEPWGIDSGIPSMSIKSIDITLDNESFNIPKRELADLFNPNFGSSQLYFKDKNTFYLVMENGDGAGGYGLAFVFKDKKYVNRYIFRGF